MTARDRAIRAHLRSLQEPDGFLETEKVVADARNPASPIHDQFEWDDAKAAHQHRLQQARHLIREFRYVETTTEVELNVPEWVNATRDFDKKQGYFPISVVKTRAELRQEVLQNEIKAAIAALSRGRAIAEELGLSASFEFALTALQNLQRAAA